MKVLVLGLRALVGVQGGIESHVRDLVASVTQLEGIEVEFEVVERSVYIDSSRVIPDELSAVRLTSIWCVRSVYFEAIIHTTLGVFYAALRRPDILHIHGIGPAIVTPLAKIFGLKVVVTHHGEDYAREKWGKIARKVLKIGEYCAARFADELIVIAPTLDRKLAARYGREFRYIPNGIHLAKPIGNLTSIQRYGLMPGKYILHVGRFVPEKRQTDLIAAFLRINAPDWHLVLVGGSDHSSAYSAQVEASAAIDPRVVLTGAIERSHVAELLEHAAVFALPSTHEGLPIALLEAMSYGLPVLVSDLPNLLALDLPKDCYVPVGDVARIVERLKVVVANTETGLIRVDWSSWLRTYTIESVAERTVDTYADCKRTTPSLKMSERTIKR